MTKREIDKRMLEIENELREEYKDGETCWAANLEVEYETLEDAYDSAPD